MEKHSKRYNSAIKVADLTKEYPLNEAVEILSKFPKAKFDETIELSFRLGVDPAQGDQMVRGDDAFKVEEKIDPARFIWEQLRITHLGIAWDSAIWQQL